MIIDDFDIVWAVRFPAKADVPLVIDTNGVLTLSVSLERFKAISGWNSEVIECCSSVNLGEFPQGNALNVRVFRSSKKTAVYLQAKERIIKNAWE